MYSVSIQANCVLGVYISYRPTISNRKYYDAKVQTVNYSELCITVMLTAVS